MDKIIGYVVAIVIHRILQKLNRSKSRKTMYTVEHHGNTALSFQSSNNYEKDDGVYHMNHVIIKKKCDDYY